MKLGEAIIEALQNAAFEAAATHYRTRQRFDPSVTLERLQEALERGGFEFRTAAPLREVNAGLIHLDGIVKDGGRYKAADSDEILKLMKPPDPTAGPSVVQPPIFLESKDDDEFLGR